MDRGEEIFLNRFFVGMLLMSGVALLFSVFGARLLGLVPCSLCKWQRVPFMVLILGASGGLFGFRKRGFFRLVQGALFLGMGLGCIHFLIQMGVFSGFCSSARDFGTPEEFVKGLQRSSCSSISWPVLGVPVSLINGLSLGTVLGLSIYLKRKYHRRRRS
ncbi:hypothetical protein NEPTK9_001227 [Candidatus Neptunochlamydia vexilliferae]|uniref:Disulfide bond formation protein B n=1 Tax=Candidatus Neptunichlamydia vexilliferae TaxID=1651774 RepID=A0ABS0AZZ8_9BACT|nr:hypothetical protein [Candidatus Neptunochlamydia vexilliferae]